MAKQTIDLAQNNSADKPFQLRDLGTLLRIRFERTLNHQDIDDAVNHLEEGLGLLRLGLDHHPIASTLDVALVRSFFNDTDLTKFIFCHRKLLSFLPSNVYKKTHLDILGYSLMDKF